MPPQLITPLLIAKQTDGNLLMFSCHGADTWFSSFLITAAKWPLHLLEGTFCLSFLNSRHDFPVFLLLRLQLPYWILHFWSLYQHSRDVAPCPRLWPFGGLFTLPPPPAFCWFVFKVGTGHSFSSDFSGGCGLLRTERSLSCSRWFHPSLWAFISSAHLLLLNLFTELWLKHRDFGLRAFE